MRQPPSPSLPRFCRGARAIVHYDPKLVLSKVLAITLVGLLIGKLFFGVRLRALARWLDRVVNACIIAIVVVYSIQLVIYLVTRH